MEDEYGMDDGFEADVDMDMDDEEMDIDMDMDDEDMDMDVDMDIEEPAMSGGLEESLKLKVNKTLKKLFQTFKKRKRQKTV